MHVVLIGAGHSHLLVAQRAHSFIQHGIKVTLVSPDLFWYSGLATGVLSGQYDLQEDFVDPQPLIEKHGGTFIRDTLVGLDIENKTVVLSSGKTLNYDALSFNIGSEVNTHAIPGVETHAIPVKPISNLWKLHEKIRTSTRDTLRIIIIGGGATGCEVAATIASLGDRLNKSCKVQLITKGERLMDDHSPRISAVIEAILRKKEVQVVTSTPIGKVEEGMVNGEYHSDITILATGLVTPKILDDIDLVNFPVKSTLQSTVHPEIFGAGDCITFEGEPLPKLGVFAVREAPILCHNLMAYLMGKQLKEYSPQTKYLSILNIGDGTALAIRGNLYWHGRLSYWLKDYLDRSFLRTFR